MLSNAHTHTLQKESRFTVQENKRGMQTYPGFIRNVKKTFLRSNNVSRQKHQSVWSHFKKNSYTDVLHGNQEMGTNYFQKWKKKKKKFSGISARWLDLQGHGKWLLNNQYSCIETVDTITPYPCVTSSHRLIMKQTMMHEVWLVELEGIKVPFWKSKQTLKRRKQKSHYSSCSFHNMLWKHATLKLKKKKNLP